MAEKDLEQLWVLICKLSVKTLSELVLERVLDKLKNLTFSLILWCTVALGPERPEQVQFILGQFFDLSR